jgi:hypothetical protein
MRLSAVSVPLSTSNDDASLCRGYVPFNTPKWSGPLTKNNSPELKVCGALLCVCVIENHVFLGTRIDRKITARDVFLIGISCRRTSSG